MDCLQGSELLSHHLLEHQPPLDPGHPSDGLFSQSFDFDLVHSLGLETFCNQPANVSFGADLGLPQRYPLRVAVSVTCNRTSETRRGESSVINPTLRPPLELPHRRHVSWSLLRAESRSRCCCKSERISPSLLHCADCKLPAQPLGKVPHIEDLREIEKHNRGELQRSCTLCQACCI
jgi:hypothetical protein